jgi:hypothetical protein
VLSGYLAALLRRSIDSTRTRTGIGLLLMAVAALFLGYGPGIGGDHGAYAFLFKWFPGLSGVRSPARLGMFVSLGVAVLAAGSFAYVRDKMVAAGRKQAFTAACFLLVFAEMWTMPIALAYPKDGIVDHREAIAWLTSNAGGRPVLELPMSEGSRPQDLEPEVRAMLRMLEHGNPIVNGYSGYFPVAFEQLKDAMRKDPVGRGRRYVDAFGAEYLLVHKHQLSEERRRVLEQAYGKDTVYEDGRDAIYRTRPGRVPLHAPTSILPSVAKFRQEPEEGSVVSVRLSSVVQEAFLLQPLSSWYIEFSWLGRDGAQRTKQVRIRGSVILDSGQNRLQLLLFDFKRGKDHGEARLVSSEEIADAFGKR